MKLYGAPSGKLGCACHNACMTHDGVSGNRSIGIGLVVGMSLGVAVGLLLGLFVFDNVGMGLSLGIGIGSAAGIGPAVRRAHNARSRDEG